MVLLLLIAMHWCVYAAEGTSLIANTIVVYLVVTENTKDLKEYKNLLVLNGIVDYTCTLIGLFNNESLEITQGVWVHIFGWPANSFPKQWHYVFVGAYSFKLSFGISSLVIQYGYRWYRICKKKQLTIPQLVGIFVGTLLFGMHFWMMFGLAFWVSDYKYTNHTFLKSNRYIFEDQKSNPTILISDLRNFPILEVSVTAVVGNCVIAYLIGYFAYHTIRELRESETSMAMKTRKLQSQMNRMLFTQTACVFSTALIPLMIMLYMMFTAIEIQGLGTFINMLMSWIPVLNPTCTLLLVHRFRSRFFAAVLPFTRRRRVVVSNYDTTNAHISRDPTPINFA